MSDKDRPSNPFGRGDRTIIRPNPGGRLPQQPPNPTPQPVANPQPFPPTPAAPSPVPYPQQPGGQPAAPYPGQAPYPAAPYPGQPPYPGTPQTPQYPPGAYPAPQAPLPMPGAPPPPPEAFRQVQQYAPAPATHAAEEWIQTPHPQQAQAPMAMQAAPNFRVDDLVAPNSNPIMRAAGPLLVLLGRLRIALSRASFASLMEQVATAIKFFETDIRSAGISEQQANSAKYILCATADDIVQHIPTEDRHVWTQYSMLSRFFGERVGGVRFFDILEHAKLDPLINYPLLELQHAALALGFQGVYRSSGGGLAGLQKLQRDLYELLRRVKPKVIRDLSPRWQGQSLANTANRLRVPAWLVASVAGALLLALFLTLRALLTGGAESAAEMTATLHPTDPIQIKRRMPAPPPPPPPPPPKPDIKFNDCIQFVPTASLIVIRLCGEFLFDSGQADVKAGFAPVAADIARFLNGTPGPVKVIGHTDSTPIKTVRFPSNQVLSKERAQAVANALRKLMNEPDRLAIEGKGPDVPVATNATADGRAKNRRVEISVPRPEQNAAQKQ
jgi:type VI secretion system protein ImpK